MSADFAQVVMLDDIDLSIINAHFAKVDVPKGTVKAIAGYVNGKYANWPAIVQKWAASGLHMVSIDVQANSTAGAQCLDIEKGDATIGQAVAWFKATQAAGFQARDLRWFPKFYISAGSAASLVATLAAAGIRRDEYMIWSAHYTNKPHICAPGTCGYPQADATQWTSSADGASLDESLCFAYFFAGPGDAVPTDLAVVPKATIEASYRGVTVLWEAVDGAQAYDVQLIQGKQEAGRLKTIQPKAVFPVAPETDYAVRVACLPDGEWSKGFPFKTPAAPTVVPPKPPVADPVPVVVQPVYEVQVLAADATVALKAGAIILTVKEAS